MIGYTRKVGLRKSRLHFDALRMQHMVNLLRERMDMAANGVVFPRRFPPDAVVYEDPYAQESDDGQVHGPDGWWGGS